MKHLTLRRTSTFPADSDTIWQHLLELPTLQHVAHPYASFTPVCTEQSNQWQAGVSYRFHFRLFCLVPLGVHTIQVQEIDRAALTIYTHESNPHVPVWNHRIVLHPVDDEHTSYTDEVEIGTGWKTPFVFLWAWLFYGHRQRKWRKWLAR